MHPALHSPFDSCRRPLKHVIGAAAYSDLTQILLPHDKYKPMLGIQLEMGTGERRRGFTGTYHSRGEWAYLELEQASVPGEPDVQRAVLLQVNRRLADSGTSAEACQATVEAIQAHTGYDRVMAYMFHEDKHGEVIAEQCRPGVESFLGMHFPALDIPDQARALFVRNVYTHIPRVQYEEVRVLPRLSPPPRQEPPHGLGVCIWMHLVNGMGNSPSPGRPSPGVVKQDTSSGGSVDTTTTRSDPQRVKMSSGERPPGAAKGKQSDTEALCQTPTPLPGQAGHRR